MITCSLKEAERFLDTSNGHAHNAAFVAHQKLLVEVVPMVEKMMARSVRLLFTGGLMATLGMAGTASAQDNTNIQRVEITGSSIKRATAETASPVQVINREELLRSGKSTVSEYLQTLTVDG